MSGDPHPLRERWQAAWPQALEAWSKYTRLHDPRLCSTRVEAAVEGLRGSFAMIRLDDQRVVIDLEHIQALGLGDYPVEILAHEIGHHVLAPASATDQFRLLARIRRGLPTLEQAAPMVANLYPDLLINDRLQRQADLRLADIFRILARGGTTGQGGRVWNLYLRIYENLWKRELGNLGAERGDDGLEADAWLGARLIRVYARDWLLGAGRFAALLLHYLVEDAQDDRQGGIAPLLDTRDAAVGCMPQGGLEIEEDELEGAIHPAEDPAISGLIKPDGEPLLSRAKYPKGGGQTRDPYEYGEIFKAAGLCLDAHEMAVRYYRERALPHLVPFPVRLAPDSPEPQMEGLEPWDMGDPLDEVDWLQSTLLSPCCIPGLTTVRRLYGQEPGQAKQHQPMDLDLYVDSSGSMPNPQVQISWLSLAGAVIALSALRAGASVQVTLWSGKNQYLQTPGFIRQDLEILRVLTGFYGGATCFPIHCLRETYAAPRPRPTHILMLSDDGITTMFDNDEQGNKGWDIAARAMKAAGAGGSMALNIPGNWEKKSDCAEYKKLRHARNTMGWEIHAISRQEDLLEFARGFSRKFYGGGVENRPE